MTASTKRAPGRRTASQLVASGEVTRRQVYAATLVLARLHDRGIAFTLTLEDMCEVLGYVGPSRRPADRRPVSTRPARTRLHRSRV